MTTELAQKLEGVRDFKKILETVVKELGETYSADLSQIVLSNPLDRNLTSICEYKLFPEVVAEELPVAMSFPLPLEGTGLGLVTLARRAEFHENEINWIRITIAELVDIIRHAQINDVVQRDTFRNTFLFEIQNVMQYSLGLGDALFMVVNILGKVLQASRCLFICVDDTQAGWKCYEFWQRERVQSCQQFGWPTTDSPIVARSLLTTAPLIIQEANENSHATPAQDELQLLGVRSLLGVPLRSESSTHGCIIVQHCDSRHAWTRSEIDMVQNVADTVAEALAKLPAEKRAHEPIMRLHQREVIEAGEQKESILAVRRALRGALGNTSIPSAQKSGAPKPSTPAKTSGPSIAIPSPGPAATPAAGASPLAAQMQSAAPPAAPTATPAPTSLPAPEAPPAPAAADIDPEQTYVPPPPTTAGQQPIGPLTPNMVTPELESTISDLANSLMQQAGGDNTEDVAASLKDLLGGLRGGSRSGEQSAVAASDVPETSSWAAPTPGTSTVPPAPIGGAIPPAPAGSSTPAAPASSNWGDLDAIGVKPASALNDQAEPTAAKWGDLDSIGAPRTADGGAAPQQQTGGQSKWGNLDSIGTPAGGGTASEWGNLDSIPTPSAGPAKGLGGALSKRSSASAPASPLLASLHRDKSKFQSPQEKVEFVDGGAIQIDDVQAQAKIKQLLSNSNPTSDYIFATPGVDARILGRIDGWISQVEAKDKYNGPHAMQVAEYSVAMARMLGLPQQEVDTIRLAAILHDVGKLGLPGTVLQKPEDELSDNELILIMKHPIEGASLVNGYPELAHLAPIILAHHEEYDKNGYPAGLGGEEIPLAARIIHIASDYHGMTCASRSRAAMNAQEAQQTLMACAGKAYDPGLVSVLIACVQQGLAAAR